MMYHNEFRRKIYWPIGTVTMAMQPINLLALELFFLILAHPVYKMLIIQEPNMLQL